MKVLVADDEEVVLSVLDTFLSDLGHDMVPARDGIEAWELLQRDDAPSLVILDWLMPGLSGVEVCRRIREANQSPYQYVIMLTAKDKTTDLVHGMDAGADDYLRKPFDERELRARVHVGERILLMHDELRAQAVFDSLTGLLNRAAILERLRRALDLARPKQSSTSVILVDLDHFKAINDAHGHAMGDHVLQEASKRWAGSMRIYDELGRYGGEEFLAVLPQCDPSCALAVAQRMRAALADDPVSIATRPLRVTASFGVASGAYPVTAETLIALADKALYEAKRAGRNRVETGLPQS